MTPRGKLSPKDIGIQEVKSFMKVKILKKVQTIILRLSPWSRTQVQPSKFK